MPDLVTNWQERYNAHRIVTVRLRIRDRPGGLALALDAPANTGASIGNVHIVGADSTHKVRDVQIFCVDERSVEAVVAAFERIEDVELLHVTDEVLDIHRGGAIETRSRVPLETVMDLRMVYTPGVARVCELIAEQPDAAWTYTSKAHRIAIVTNGTAVLGLGDIGPLASLPVMEGKAAILARFAGVSCDPILIDETDPQRIVDTVASIASTYGAIQLEDIAAPECFDIEEKLQERLDVPVFHDDQHGTATVMVAGLITALRATNRTPESTTAVVLGAGAAGTAIARFLVDFGLKDVVVCDSTGTIYAGRTERMNPWKERLAKTTNAGRVAGSLADAMAGRDVFVGVSKPNVVSADMVGSMAKNAIVFALANPVSEIPVDEARAAGAAVAIDGRSMNNALAFPGIFRGALDARAKRITHAMKLAAAEALAEMASGDQLLPDMLDPDVHRRVASAVAAAAR